jgi:hypothetical protein
MVILEQAIILLPAGITAWNAKNVYPANSAAAVP